MEKWSKIETKRKGGPWQSLENGVDFYIYYFIKENEFFVFRVKELVKRLEEKMYSYDVARMLNQGWTTVGYKAPKTDILDLVIRLEDLN